MKSFQQLFKNAAPLFSARTVSVIFLNNSRNAQCELTRLARVLFLFPNAFAISRGVAQRWVSFCIIIKKALFLPNYELLLTALARFFFVPYFTLMSINMKVYTGLLYLYQLEKRIPFVKV